MRPSFLEMTTAVEALLCDMRPQVRDEVLCFVPEGGSIASEVQLTIDESVQVEATWCANGALLAIWGVLKWSPLPDAACAWCLTTNHVDEHKLSFWRDSKSTVARLAKEYGSLCNLVDSRYPEAIRWAEALGFVDEGSALAGGAVFKLMVRRVRK